MSKRRIIKIDQDKCNGCGLCIPNCQEGAIRIINHKAQLVNDSLCDGLGACLGHCPEGAITIEERDVAAFKVPTCHGSVSLSECPGAKVMDLRGKGKSGLQQWPIQIMLLPVVAAYFDNADILIAADCVAFSYPRFHDELLEGKTLMVGCPKLDDLQVYKDKITHILKSNSVKSITYAHMEVPCCFGLVQIIKDAITQSNKDIPYRDITISIKGERLS